MIKRATILKYLKYHGKYERRHFTMKKVELENECKTLGIDLTKNIDNQPVKEAVKVTKQKVVIQEPDSSSDDETSDEEQVPQPPTPAPSPKKLKRKQTIQKVEKVKVKSDPDNRVKVTEIIKQLNRAIKELFGEFDQKDLDQDDVIFLQNEFNLTLNEAQDLIDPLVADFNDNEIAKIEAKIDLQYKKLDRFLS